MWTGRGQVVAVGEVAGPLVVLGLDLQRRQLPAVGQLDRAAAGDVVADLADRPDRVLQGQVAQHLAGLDHPQHQVGRADLEHGGRLAHVGVADDDVQPAVVLGVGVRLVAGVDDRPRPGGGAGDALPDVVGPLADAVDRAARGLQHLARAADHLPGDKERDQDVGEPLELAVPADQVVLVAAVGVAGRVGVVLEQVDLAADALLGEPALRVGDQALEDPLPRLVVDHELADVVALGRRVLRVRADVEVEPRAVAEEDVARPAPRDDPAEEVAGDLVRAEPALTLERAGHAVLVLDAEDPALHVMTLRRRVRSLSACRTKRREARPNTDAGALAPTLRPVADSGQSSATATGTARHSEAGALYRSHHPRASHSNFPPIADYAFLSDCESSCLIAPVRGGRVDVRAAAGLPQRLRRDPGPRGRTFPAQPVRRGRPDRAPLPARQPDAGDDLADPDRLADRPRRPDDGALAQHRRAVPDPSPYADRLRRRARAAAHREVRVRARSSCR